MSFFDDTSGKITNEDLGGFWSWGGISVLYRQNRDKLHCICSYYAKGKQYNGTKLRRPLLVYYTPVLNLGSRSGYLYKKNIIKNPTVFDLNSVRALLEKLYDERDEYVRTHRREILRNIK